MTLRIAELRTRSTMPDAPAEPSSPEQDYRNDIAALFVAMAGAPTLRERAEIRERAHRELNRYLDRRFAETARLERATEE